MLATAHLRLKQRTSPWRVTTVPQLTRAGFTGPQSRPRVPTTRALPIASLGDIVATAVELNRGRAADHGVRVLAYVMDQTIADAQQGALFERIDRLLGRTIPIAHWGSTITCQAGLARGEMKLHINYARAVRPSPENPIGCDDIDEWWSWPIATRDRPQA